MLFNKVVFTAIAAFAASAQAADSCSAGAIIGINAVCGTDPKDCGSGRCCLADQKCVPSGSSFACSDSNLSPGETVTVNAGCYAASGSTPSTSSAKPSSFGSGSTTSSGPGTPTGGASATQTGTDGSSTKTSSKTGSETSSSQIGSETASGTQSGSYSSKASQTGTGGSFVTATATASETSISSLSSSAKGTKGPSYSSSVVTSVVLAPYTFTNGTIDYPGATGPGSSGSGPKSTSVAQSNSATSAFSSPQNSIVILLSAIAVAALCL